jgi:hypothetical protein
MTMYSQALNSQEISTDASEPAERFRARIDAEGDGKTIHNAFFDRGYQEDLP